MKQRSIASFDRSFRLRGSPSVKIHGISGLTLARVTSRMLNTVRDFQPNVVFLQLGGNDIRSDYTPEEIAYGLISFATLLRNR